MKKPNWRIKGYQLKGMWIALLIQLIIPALIAAAIWMLIILN